MLKLRKNITAELFMAASSRGLYSGRESGSVEQAMTHVVTHLSTLVDTGLAATTGRLLFNDGRLCALIVKLDDGYEELEGRWFLEIGFGSCEAHPAPMFDTIDDAEQWVMARLDGTSARVA
jgi:hypothetical protein